MNIYLRSTPVRLEYSNVPEPKPTKDDITLGLATSVCLQGLGYVIIVANEDPITVKTFCIRAFLVRFGFYCCIRNL